MRSEAILFVAALACGCEAEMEKPAPAGRGSEAKALSSVAGTRAAAPSGSSSEGVPIEQPGLRRGYGAKEGKVGQCAKLEGDRVVRGTKCPTGFVVYGQYIKAPPNSDVELRFEIDTQTKIYLSSDIVSGMGTKLHAGLNEQVIDAGTRRWIGYRVHIYGDTPMLEGRIHVRADEPATFAINDLGLTVR
jgi:hypothetical protein